MSRWSRITLYFYSALLCITASLNATDWVVSTTGGGAFTNIYDAVYSTSVVSGDTILLAAEQTFTGANNRGITIAKNLTFDRIGVGNNPIIDMGSLDRFCTVSTGVTISMSNLVISHGLTTSSGGAIENKGILNIDSCTFSNNRSTTSMGAIYNSHTLNATNCVFSYNSATNNVGALHNAGNVNLDGCTFSHNSAGTFAGAVSSFGTTFVATGCTFNNNTAQTNGGAIYHYDGSITVQCCRFMNNAAASGSAFYNGSGSLVSIANNWWGTNVPDASMFHGPIGYEPYIVINLLPNPLSVSSYCPTFITADFTQNSSGDTSPCTDFFSGTVTFSTAAGTVSPATSTIIDGKATTTLSGITTDLDPFSLCAITNYDVTTTSYTYCAMATPIAGALAYVSPSGDDANPGTESSPVKTITRGIDIATSCGVTGTVYLESDTTFTGAGNKNITIAKSVIITKWPGSGADPIIDMENVGRFCHLTAPVNVYISNLVIQNGNEDSGGALYNEQAVLMVTDCTFNRNVAMEGGAIASIAPCTMVRCTFNQNNVLVSGGAVLIDTNTYTTAQCIDCTFNSNTASLFCGAVGINPNTTCDFIGCIFNANKADQGGGAVGSYGTMHSAGCTFCNNSAKTGGAFLNNTGVATINCSRFLDNTATPSGSAIYNDGGTIDAKNNWWGTNIPDANSLFYGTVYYTPWLVINILPNPLYPFECLPTLITADFTQNSSGDASPCTDFFSGTVTFSTAAGTIVPTARALIDGQATVTLSGIANLDTFSLCVFADTDITTTPYEYCKTATPIIATDVYVSPSGDDANTGSIDNPVKTIARGIEIATSCGFTGTVYLEAGATFTGIGNKDITIAANVNIAKWPGVGDDPIIDMESVGRFCTINTTVTVSMSDLVIQNGIAAVIDGGAVNNGGYMYATRCTFDGNEDTIGGGGALYIRDDCILQAANCIFSNNNAGPGGAIYSGTSSIITVANCNFNNNDANGNGGVISSEGSIYATSCTFNNNTATGTAGAIRFSLLNATNCTFNNNSALNGGGVLYGVLDASLNIVGCTFNNNSTPDAGGAIRSSCQTASVRCCRFINNTAAGDGDAIYHDVGTLFDATNNWWGTNTPNASNLFYGNVSYTPWLVINLLPTEMYVPVNCPPLLITADFTQNSSGDTSPCTDFFSGTVTFSTAAGTIVPTARALIDGQATVTLSGIASFDPFSLCVFTDADVTTTPYEYCRTATPITGTDAYVSPSGNDANPGTITSPVKTIARGIEIATSCGITGTVYLEAGATFTGTGNKNITIASNVNITRYGIGADPVIDMEGAGRFCTINTVVTVSMSNLVVQNGLVGAGGGALYNSAATLNAINCVFSGNSAKTGGALYNSGGNIAAMNCIFSNNNAGVAGGALYNSGVSSSSTIHCCRFIGNTASQGSAISNGSGTIDASNNWWGSNANPATIPNLLYGTITSSPWIQMAFNIDPTLVGPGDATTLTVTFSSSCIPDGTPVTFSSIDGTITPTIGLTSDGTCVATMSSYLSLARACVTTDNQTLCATFNTTGFARFNFGCICSDTGDEHVLIGAYDDPLGTNNLLLGCIFDSSTSTTRAVTPVDIGAHIINSIAVYNTENVTYMALLTRLAGSYFLRLGTCTDQGTGLSFMLSTSLVALDGPASKVQWALSNDATPYVVTDVQDTLSIFEANLATLSLSLHDTTTNMAGASMSSFLYWSFQDTGLYLVQGYDTASVATYQVDQDSGLFIGTGVATDVGSELATSHACSTCYDYLTLGGSDLAGHATLASYNITANGSLEHITSATLPGTAVNYCERCCCSSNPLLVATDDGLYATNPATFAIVASNTTMPDNNWVNACWCCDSSLVYCLAINGAHNSYIFRQQGTDLVKLLDL